eukprot:6738020-Lingulodinium_polyedra.AAC.1
MVVALAGVFVEGGADLGGRLSVGAPSGHVGRRAPDTARACAKTNSAAWVLSFAVRPRYGPLSHWA